MGERQEGFDPNFTIKSRDLFEGKLPSQFDAYAPEDQQIVREIISAAIEDGQKNGFKPGDVVVHPSLERTGTLVSVDDNKMFAVVNDTVQDHTVSYPELLSPDTLARMMAVDVRGQKLAAKYHQ